MSGNGSSQEMREHLQEIDCLEVFEALERLNVNAWRYRPEIADKQDDHFAHMSPYPEDIKALFAIGNGRTLAFLDVVGIAIAGAKGAGEKIRMLEDRIATLERTVNGPPIDDVFEEVRDGTTG